MAFEQNDLFWAYIRAASPLTDPQTLSMLSFCRWTPIRRRVAGNNNTPVNILEILSVDPAAEVRAAVASNPATPRDVVERIIFDIDIEVRLEIAKNPDTPRYAIERLVNDHEAIVSSAARLTLRLYHAPDTTAEASALSLKPIFPVQPGYPPPDLPIRRG